jgi:TRAP-type uncharacterized transport system substrate-binding protein
MSAPGSAAQEALESILRFNPRNLVAMVVIAAVAGPYLYYASYRGTDSDFLEFVFERRKQAYIFCGGPEGGFYMKLARLVEREAPKSLRLKAAVTTGSLDNGRKVANSERSLGIVQADTYAHEPGLAESAQIICPLYMGRMHILYDAQAFERSARESWSLAADETSRRALAIHARASNAWDEAKEEPVFPALKPRLRQTLDPFSRRFLAHARMSAGPVGSGTRVLASYLLDLAGIGNERNEALDFTEALNRLSAAPDDPGSLAVAMVFAAPLDIVKETLESSGGRIRLLGIDSALTAKLSRDYGVAFQPTDFGDSYIVETEGGGRQNLAAGVATIGTHSLLIASKDVPEDAIAAALKIIDENRSDPTLTRSVPSPIASEDDMIAGARRDYEERAASRRIKIVSGALVFAGYWLAATLVGFGVVAWAFSTILYAKYMQRIAGLYQKYKPVREIPEDSDAGPAIAKTLREAGVPVLEFGEERARRRSLNCTENLREIIALEQNAREDCAKGNLIIRHEELILANLAEARQRTLRLLSEQVYWALAWKKSALDKAGPKARDECRKALANLCAAGYLSIDECELLAGQLADAPTPDARNANKKKRRDARR